MADWTGQALVCATRTHAEHGAILKALTPERGLIAGYVRGGRSTRLRPLLLPGNRLKASWRARVDAQMGAFTLELDRSAAGAALGDPLASGTLAWATTLTADALPEFQPYPAVYAGLDALVALLVEPADPRLWLTTLVRYELLLLAELGFGLDLARCGATGAADDLVWVSPKSGRAVSRQAGAPYAGRLLPLPDFLIRRVNAAPDWPAVAAGLALSGHFIERWLIGARRDSLAPARRRLVERLPASTKPAEDRLHAQDRP